MRRLFFYLSANSIEIFSTHRLQSYNIFIKIISLDYISFLFGSNSQNQIYLTIPGVFNYYLDFIYNFGFISLIPILFLIIYTIKEVIINPKILRILKVEDLIIFLIIFYMIFIDSFIRTSFKQPYLGIILFILWGILISKLSSFKKNDNI